MSMNIGSIAKSIGAGFTAFAGTYATANLDGVVTQGEWVAIAVATLAGLGLVYTVPNAAQSDPKPTPADSPTSDLDAALADLDKTPTSDAAGTIDAPVGAHAGD